MKQTFLNKLSDCNWLRETHLKPENINNSLPYFKSFTIHGNEDSPSHLSLYGYKNPLVDDNYYLIKTGKNGKWDVELIKYK